MVSHDASAAKSSNRKPETLPANPGFSCLSVDYVQEAKRAVEAGYWPLYRYNPAEEQPFKWETKEATASFQEFIRSENRYKSLFKTSPADAEDLLAKAEADAKRRMTFYKNLGEIMK